MPPAQDQDSAPELKPELGIDFELEPGAWPQSGADAAELRSASAAVAEWQPEPASRAEPLRVAFDSRWVLELGGGRQARLRAASPSGAHALSVSEGSGVVTVLTDSAFLRNSELGKRDHAEFAVRLTRLAADRAALVIVEGDVVTGLFAELSRRGRPLLFALCVLGVLFVWARAPRVGPLQPDPEAERRDLMEHVLATGQFLLRTAGEASLVTPVRAALLRRIELRYPHWLQLAAADLAQQLAVHTGLDAARIQWALETERAGTADPVEKIRTLEQIRKRT